MLLSSSAFSQNVLEITLVEDPWPPYIEGQPGELASGGKLIKLYDEVFKQVDGLKVNYYLEPWKRALIEVEQGKRDGIMALFKTPERLEVMDFTVPIFTGRTMLWYSTKKFQKPLSWNKIEDLTPYNLIMLRASAMGRPLKEARANGIPLTITEVNNHQQQFEILSVGRGDIAVLTEIVGYHYIGKRNWQDHIVPMDKPLTEDDVYYMAFSKKSPARKFIPQINRVIENMKESGRLTRILTVGE